jgi:peptide/nickel transport system substrate-binding protein
MKSVKKVFIPLLLVLSLLLAACGKPADAPPTDNGENTESQEPGEQVKEETPEVKEVVITPPYPTSVKRNGKTIGGTLNVALVSDTPFQGIFNTFLYEDNNDWQVMQPMLGSFMISGPDYEIANGGYCDVEFDKDSKTATYKINKDLTWSDGVPVTSDDLIFVYECIGHPDYTGVRYDSDYINVVGMEEYHNGDADSISGLKRIDDKTLEVTFKEFYPGIMWGAGMTYNAEPAHYLKDIPVEDMESSDQVRLKPLSCGPFVVSNIVPGESVEYSPNPHWFGEKPQVDKVVIKRTGSDTVVEAMKAGTFDLFPDVNVNYFTEFEDLNNIDIVSDVATVYGYIGFKLGKWDNALGEVVVDPNKKMSDVNLRRAIAYAMDNDQIAEVFYNNLRITANTLIDPSHGKFWNNQAPGYKYDPEKAKQILDEAGYKDVDGDGMREKPDGSKLQINFLAMSGGDIAEPLSQFYIQCWRDVGLDVGLQNGRLIEMNAFYDMVEEDNEDIDIYMGAWQTGSNPDPSGLYGRNSMFNYSRFASDKNDELLAAIASEDAIGEDGIDYDYLVKAYHDWQDNMVEQAPVVPTHYRVTLGVVNKRVSYYDLGLVTDWRWEKVGLLSDKPELAK